MYRLMLCCKPSPDIMFNPHNDLIVPFPLCQGETETQVMWPAQRYTECLTPGSVTSDLKGHFSA